MYDHTRQREPLPRRALTFSVLRLFGHRLTELDMPWLDKQVHWVAALWAFWGAARMSALLVDKLGPDSIRAVSFDKITYLKPDHFTARLPLPKNTKESVEFLDLRSFSDHRYCPIHQLNLLMERREQMCGGRLKEEDYIFLKSNGKILTMDEMNATLKAALLPLFPEDVGFWSCHSFRAGLSTTMANYPDLFSKEEIQAVGRWNSDAYKAYCRNYGITQQQAYDKMMTVLYQH